jgi:membrane-bound lytic murein transglycosylase F
MPRAALASFFSRPARAAQSRLPVRRIFDNMRKRTLIVRTGLAGLIGTAGVIGLACFYPVSWKPLAAPDGEREGTVLLREPQIERDLKEIRAGGVLRVALRNNDSSYLILGGQEYGFEYELATQLARDLGVKLETVLPDSSSSLLTMLNLGLVDLVASPVSHHPDNEAASTLTQPYNHVQQVLVVRRDDVRRFRTAADLSGVMVAVRRWSTYERTLVTLREQGIDVGMVVLSPSVSTEEILEMVADGTYPATLANRDVASAALTYRPELAISLPMTQDHPVSWAVRANSSTLLDATNSFLSRHYRIKERGRVARSELYNVLYRKYFSDERQIRRRDENPFQLARTGRLSPYDELVQTCAERYNFDWLLIASMITQESRFDPTKESWAGAVGLMQLLPTTAGVSPDSLRIPEVNVEVGVRYFRELYDAFAYLPERDRVAFALASYNAGRGHVDDARMLSIMRGGNPNVWDGSVAESLLLLRNPEHHALVRYGYVRGTETVAYVHEVLRRYDLMLHLMASNDQRLAREPVAMARTASFRAVQ